MGEKFDSFFKSKEGAATFKKAVEAAFQKAVIAGQAKPVSEESLRPVGRIPSQSPAPKPRG